jgi:hypothetical protein
MKFEPDAVIGQKRALCTGLILVPGEEWFREGVAGGGFVNLSGPITQISFDKIRLKCK